MTSTFEQLCDWLHASRPEGTIPQWGAADLRKKGLWWCPGNRARAAGETVRMDRVAFLGTTPRSFRNPLCDQHSQESWISWCGIDIDWEDQPLELQKDGALAVRVAEAISDGLGMAGSLRSSCGGRGVHVLFRLAIPIPLPANPGTGAATAIVEHLTRPFVRQLEDAKVAICKADNRMFWVWGGKNDWIVQTDRMLDVDPMLLGKLRPSPSNRPIPAATDQRGLPEWVASDDFVKGWLDKLNAQPGLVYVGTIVERLRALGETVWTESRMSGNGTPNGYIDVSPGRISLWTYADGRTIWCAEDVERTVAAMMGGDK